MFVEIEPNEVRDVMLKVQRYHSLETVAKIIQVHPERINGFDLEDKHFQNLEQEINLCQKECQDWWKKISSKYGLSHDAGFHVDYETCILELIE